MQVTNEIKRIRGKLKILEMDYIQEFMEEVSFESWTSPYKDDYVKVMKREYLRQLEEILPKDPTQQEIKFY